MEGGVALDAITALGDRWREQGAQIAPYAPAAAQAFRECARELFDALRAHNDAVLTLAQAAAESGYNADHLGRQVRARRIPNAGRKGKPLIRRGDLPLKHGLGNKRDAQHTPARYRDDGLFRDIIDSKRGSS